MANNAAGALDDVLRQSHEAFTSALDATLTSSSLEQDLAPVVALLADPKRRIWFAGGRFSQFVAGFPDYRILLPKRKE